jgi:hypothetical protein
MRTSKSFVLRLLADPDEPGALRGMLHSVASGEEQPFADGPALLALLAQMASAGPRTTPGDVDVEQEGEEG